MLVTQNQARIGRKRPTCTTLYEGKQWPAPQSPSGLDEAFRYKPNHFWMTNSILSGRIQLL